MGRHRDRIPSQRRTWIRFVSTVSRDEAGLVALQNDQYYYFLAVARAGGFVGTLFGLYAFGAAP